MTHPCIGTSTFRAMPKHQWMPKDSRQIIPIETEQDHTKFKLLNQIRFKEEIERGEVWTLTQAKDGSCLATITIGGSSDLALSHARRITESIYNLLAQKPALDDRAIYAKMAEKQKEKVDTKKKTKKKLEKKDHFEQDGKYFISFPHFEKYSVDDLKQLVVLFQQSFMHEDAMVEINGNCGNEPIIIKFFQFEQREELTDPIDQIAKLVARDSKREKRLKQPQIGMVKKESSQPSTNISLEEKEPDTENYELVIKRENINPSTEYHGAQSLEFKTIFFRSLQECGVLFAEFSSVKNNPFLSHSIRQSAETPDSDEEFYILNLFHPVVFNSCVTALDNFLTDYSEVRSAYFKKRENDIYLVLELKTDYEAIYSSVEPANDLYFEPEKQGIGVRLFDYEEYQGKIIKAHTIKKSSNKKRSNEADEQKEERDKKQAVVHELEHKIKLKLEKGFNRLNEVIGKLIFQSSQSQSQPTPISTEEIEATYLQAARINGRSAHNFTMKDLEDKKNQIELEEKLKNTFNHIIKNRKKQIDELNLQWLPGKLRCELPFQFQNHEVELLFNTLNQQTSLPHRSVRLEREDEKRILILEFKTPYDFIILTNNARIIDVSKSIVIKPLPFKAPAPWVSVFQDSPGDRLVGAELTTEVDEESKLDLQPVETELTAEADEESKLGLFWFKL